MKADVTIVVPVCNNARTVERTLQSVEAQTHRPLSVILVDYGSTDGSTDILRRWKQAAETEGFRIGILEGGAHDLAEARNAGLAAVESEWTMFFDCGDAMRPDHVESAMKMTAENRALDLVGWDVMEHLPDGDKAVRRFSDGKMLRDCVMHGAMSTARYFARTDLFRRAGGWNTSMKIWADAELGVRLLQQSPKAAYRHGKPKVDIYASAESLSGPTYSSRATVAEKAIDEIERLLPEGERHIAGMKRAILAAHYRREGIIDPVPLLTRALHATPRLRHRLLLRLTYILHSTILRP